MINKMMFEDTCALEGRYENAYGLVMSCKGMIFKSCLNDCLISYCSKNYINLPSNNDFIKKFSTNPQDFMQIH